jgi:thioredoxin-related protein
MIFFDHQGQEVFRTEAFLRSFHIQSVMDYVATGAYLEEPEFQRYIERRADGLRARGVEVNLMD